MGRLPGFDYRRPFFYMVTLKKLPGLEEFSRIAATDTPPDNGRYLEATPLSAPFARTIRGFAGTWPMTYEPQTARLDKAAMYRRCHEMGDLIGRTVPPVQNSRGNER